MEDAARFERETGLPYFPDAHQFADAYLPTDRSEEHGENVRRLYDLANAPRWYYRSVSIPKQSGGTRTLHIPYGTLKSVQHFLLHSVLERLPVSPCAVAYVRGVSLSESVRVHVGKPLLVRLDLKDFFDHIGFLQVYQNAFAAYPKAVRVLLSRLCTYTLPSGRSCLPQGAPTSPYLANLCMRRADDAIYAYCARRSIAYTRYADDMTFSGSFEPERLIETVRSILRREGGFELNEEKTRILRACRRQSVTGAVVNERPRASATYRREIRQECFYCKKFGVRSHLLRTKKAPFVRPSESVKDGYYVSQTRYLEHLLGKINFTLSLDPKDREMRLCRKEVLLWLAERNAAPRER
ncbi:MAG: RNA-directed DNA polymerase [Oscillibacter sp.]|nr:RNA-directed DNA polymerase [Oscillibacter sp.]